jgi:hypothetical protein
VGCFKRDRPATDSRPASAALTGMRAAARRRRSARIDPQVTRMVPRTALKGGGRSGRPRSRQKRIRSKHQLGLQQFGDGLRDWKIHYVSHPVPGPKQTRLDRQTRKFAHAERCCVDDTVGTGNCGRDVLNCPSSVGVVARPSRPLLQMSKRPGRVSWPVARASGGFRTM